MTYEVIVETLKSLALPTELIGGVAEMQALFRAICKERRYPDRFADRMFGLLAVPLYSCPCFLDQITGLWRYKYGTSMQLPGGGSVLLGTHMFHKVERLFDILECANWRLPKQKLDAYLSRLVDPNHHQSVLAEFAPILQLSNDVAVHHEVLGFGKGKHTIDWQIHAPGQPTLFLEVKNRMFDLIESMDEFANQPRAQLLSKPKHDHSMLFRGLTEKFKESNPTEAIQAVWILSDVKQEQEELKDAFSRIDSKLLHAVILGNWQHEGYVIARNKDIERRVQKILGIRRTEKLTFTRSQS